MGGDIVDNCEPGVYVYLSESLAVEAVCVFFLFGLGILHSIWKATQLVHGMPNEAASHRTFLLFNSTIDGQSSEAPSSATTPIWQLVCAMGIEI